MKEFCRKLPIKEEELDVDFESKFSQLIASPEKQKELGNNIKKLALVNATNQIADEVENLLKSLEKLITQLDYICVESIKEFKKIIEL